MCLKAGEVRLKKGDVLLDGENPENFYFSLFSQKTCRNSKKEAAEGEIITTDEMSLFDKKPMHSGPENVAIAPKNVVNPSEAEPKTIKADLLRAEEQRKAKEAHAREQAAKYAKKPEFPDHTCYLQELRAKAIIEYGLSGWDDPLKLSSVAGLPVCLVMKGLDHLGYERYERSGGSIGYRQKRVGAPGRAEA